MDVGNWLCLISNCLNESTTVDNREKGNVNHVCLQNGFLLSRDGKNLSYAITLGERERV